MSHVLPGSTPNLAAVFFVVASFCAAHYPSDQPDELRIKFRSGKKLKAPVVAPPATRREETPVAGDDSGASIPLPGVIPVKCPGCAAAVLKLIARSEVRLTMPAIADALDAAGHGYSDSALSQTLGWLTATGILVNVTGVKPRGYEFATG
jgi:hypothetical protein